MEKFVYEDLQNMCRLCFSKTSLLSIFDVRLESTESMAEVIEVTTGVKITPKEEISHMLCNKCTHLTIRMFKFRTTSILNDSYLREKAAIQKKVHKSVKGLFRTYPNLIVPSLVINRNVSPYVTLQNNFKNSLNKSKSALLEMNSSRNLTFEPLSIEARSVAADAGLEVNFMGNFRNQEYPPPSTTEKRNTNPSWGNKNHVGKRTKREYKDQKCSGENGDPLFTVKPKYKTLHICDLCNRVFYNIGELKRHISLHMRCSLCKTSFNSMKKTKEHQADCSLRKMMNNMPTVKIKRCDQIQEIREKYTSAFQKMCIIEISEDEEDSTHDSNYRTKPIANIMQSVQESCEKLQSVKEYNKSSKMFLENSCSTGVVDTSVRSSCSENINKDIKELDQTENPKSDNTDSQKLQKADECENNKNCFTNEQEPEETSKSSLLISTLKKNNRYKVSGATLLDKSKKIEYSVIPPESSNKSSEKMTTERQKKKDLENKTVNGQNKLNIGKRREVQTYRKKVFRSEQTVEFKGSKITRIKSSNFEKSTKMPTLEEMTEILPVDRENTQRFVNSSEIHEGERENVERKRKNIENSEGVKKKKLNNVTIILEPSDSNSELNSITKKNQSQASKKEPSRPRIKICDENALVVDFEEEENTCLKNLIIRLRKGENKVERTIQTDIPSNDDVVETKGITNLRNYLSSSNISVNTSHSKVAIKHTSEDLMIKVIKSNVNKTQNTVNDNMQNKVTKFNIGCEKIQNTLASAEFLQSNKKKEIDEPQKCSAGSGEHNQSIECNSEKKQNIALLNSSVCGKEKQIAVDPLKTPLSCSANSITVIPGNTTSQISRCAISNMPVRAVNIQPPLGTYYIVNKSNMPMLTPNQLPSNANKSLTSSAKMPPTNTSINESLSYSIYKPARKPAISSTGLPLIRQLGPNIVQAQTVNSHIEPTPRSHLPTTSSLSWIDCFRQSLASKQVSTVQQTPITSTKIRIVSNNCIKSASNITTTDDSNSCTVELNKNNIRFSAANEQNNQTVTTAPENPKYIRVRNLAELKE
ncbi:uncharacterized protein LOC123317179 [Coccinella septempunctata]|uniref:uncharacterized protein LOC123317179 n=1 Tax=Coccinella septempunctata TaxID=41139 RepID=UPI001D088EFA|nr:uncharacterized protein LOC123317179 [Coccinella septempunctata]